MLTLDAAYAVAREHLDEELEAGPERRLEITRAELRERGWLFHYQSAAFLASRSFVDALGGNLPVLVDEDGQVSAVPAEQAGEQL